MLSEWMALWGSDEEITICTATEIEQDYTGKEYGKTKQLQGSADRRSFFLVPAHSIFPFSSLQDKAERTTPLFPHILLLVCSKRIPPKKQKQAAENAAMR